MLRILSVTALISALFIDNRQRRERLGFLLWWSRPWHDVRSSHQADGQRCYRHHTYRSIYPMPRERSRTVHTWQVIDVSVSAARALGMMSAGVVAVSVE